MEAVSCAALLVLSTANALGEQANAPGQVPNLRQFYERGG
jgi:hypothetical protein